MGICSSCMTNSAVSDASPTAKLVLDDGTLQEFPQHVKVSEVLHQLKNFPAKKSGGKTRKGAFVCDADDIRMDAVVPAMEAGEELKAGRVYFLLPLSVKGRRLRLNEMVDLAVNAGSAHFESSARISSLVFSERKASKEGARRVKFNSELEVILEDVEEEEEEEGEEEG